MSFSHTAFYFDVKIELLFTYKLFVTKWLFIIHMSFPCRSSFFNISKCYLYCTFMESMKHSYRFFCISIAHSEHEICSSCSKILYIFFFFIPNLILLQVLLIRIQILSFLCGLTNLLFSEACICSHSSLWQHRIEVFHNCFASAGNLQAYQLRKIWVN